MKFKTTLIIATLTMIPTVVWAGVNFLNTDPVYVVPYAENEITNRPTTQSYRLVWNQAIGKFDVVPGVKRSPITIPESVPEEYSIPQSNEPVYYGDDFQI